MSVSRSALPELDDDSLRLIFEAFVAQWEWANVIQARPYLDWKALFDFLISIMLVNKHWNALICYASPRLWCNLAIGLETLRGHEKARYFNLKKNIERSGGLQLNVFVYGAPSYVRALPSSIMDISRTRFLVVIDGPCNQSVPCDVDLPDKDVQDAISSMMNPEWTQGQRADWRAFWRYMCNKPCMIYAGRFLALLGLHDRLVTLELSHLHYMFDQDCTGFKTITLPCLKKLRYKADDAFEFGCVFQAIRCPRLEDLAVSTDYICNPAEGLYPIRTVQALAISGWMDEGFVKGLMEVTPNARILEIVDFKDTLHQYSVDEPDFLRISADLECILLPHLEELVLYNIETEAVDIVKGLAARTYSEFQVWSRNEEDIQNEIEHIVHNTLQF